MGRGGQETGHGGADFFVIYEFLDTLRTGRPSPIDVYDAATWSCIIPSPPPPSSPAASRRRSRFHGGKFGKVRKGRDMRSLVCAVCAFFLAVSAPAWPAGAGPFKGPVHDEGWPDVSVSSIPRARRCDVTVRWHDEGRGSHPCPAMVRVFDPEENLLLRHEFAGRSHEARPVGGVQGACPPPAGACTRPSCTAGPARRWR